MLTLVKGGVYLSEGDRDACIQLNVICQLGELVLLLLKGLQQTADLLLRQHDPAVVLQEERKSKRQPNNYAWNPRPLQNTCPTCCSVFSQCRQAVET